MGLQRALQGKANAGPCGDTARGGHRLLELESGATEPFGGGGRTDVFEFQDLSFVPPSVVPERNPKFGSGIWPWPSRCVPSSQPTPSREPLTHHPWSSVFQQLSKNCT